MIHRNLIPFLSIPSLSTSRAAEYKKAREIQTGLFERGRKGGGAATQRTRNGPTGALGPGPRTLDTDEIGCLKRFMTYIVPIRG